MRKKKVLFILHYSPPVHGASKVGDSILNSAKIKAAFNPKFIKIKSSQNLNEIGKFSFIKIYHLTALFFKVITTLILFRPKTIYYTISPKGFAFFRDLTIQLPIKAYLLFSKANCFLHYHARGINTFVSDSKLKLRLTSFVMSGTNLIFISKLLKTEVEKINSYKQMFFLHNGVENTLSSNEFNAIVQSRKASSEVRLLYLSNMIREKGYDEVLFLAKRLKAQNQTHIKVDFAGSWASDEDQDFFESYVSQHGLNDMVKYHGLVLNEQKKELFSKATLFVFPSSYKHEVFPLSILEALSYGLPVLGFNIGATSEIIKSKIGILTDKDAIFEDVLTMLERYQNEATYETCRDVFLNHYTVEQFENNLVNILT